MELPETFSKDLRSLLEGLLQRDINNRLGCQGGGADELKEHQFFNGIDWQQVYLQKYTPPLIPPRGEVNAADAFDIGSFDEEDTKGIKLTDADQELYKNFPLTISERWQAEVAETVFETINNETDKVPILFPSSIIFHLPPISTSMLPVSLFLIYPFCRLQLENKKAKQKQRFKVDEKGEEIGDFSRVTFSVRDDCIERCLLQDLIAFYTVILRN